MRQICAYTFSLFVGVLVPWVPDWTMPWGPVLLGIASFFVFALILEADL